MSSLERLVKLGSEFSADPSIISLRRLFIALLTAFKSRFILPDLGTFDLGLFVAISGMSSMGGIKERPIIRSDFVGLGVGIRVAVRLGSLGVGVPLPRACFCGLGVGIRQPVIPFGGLGVLARRTREVNLACVPVTVCGGETEKRDGAVTAFLAVSFWDTGCSFMLFSSSEFSAKVDLVSLGANMAHFGGATEALVGCEMMVCSRVLEDEDEEDKV